MLILLVTTGWTATYLYDEGEAVCSRVEQSVLRPPGHGRPCRILHAGGESGRPVGMTHLEFGPGGLLEASFDNDGDGESEEEIDCSVAGKILMPVTNTDRWLHIAADRQMTEEGGYAPVHYKRVGNQNREDEIIHFRGYVGTQPVSLHRFERHDSRGRVVERRVQVSNSREKSRVTHFSYDAKGRLERSRSHAHGVAEGDADIVRYEYACGR